MFGCAENGAQSASESTEAASSDEVQLPATIAEYLESPQPAVVRPIEVGEDLFELDRTASSAETLRAAVNRRDSAVKACLAVAGIDLELVPERPDATAGALDMSRQEFADTWGFGLVASFDANGNVDRAYQQTVSAGSSQRSALDQITSTGVPSTEFDLSGLPQGALESYNTLMAGDCADPGGASAEFMAVGRPLTQLRELMSSSIESDRVIVEAKIAYASCMNDAGFASVDSPPAAYDLAAESLQRLIESAGQSGTASAALRSDGAMAVEAERALAVANVGCQAAFSVATRARSQEIQRDVMSSNQALVRQVTGNR